MNWEPPWWAHMMGIIKECERRGVSYPPTPMQYFDWIQHPIEEPKKEEN